MGPLVDTITDSVELRALPKADETRAYDSAERPGHESAPPTRIGRYLIVQEIGRGGMGVVWTAYDPKLDRKIAIKLLKPASHTPTRKARFIREAQALARLNHPNIVTIHDVDTHEDQFYMAMEYVAGRTLEQWRHQGHGWRQTLSVFDRAGRGLAAAHAAGITHRDFKPSNVLIADDGRVKVLDFGLAKHMDRDDSDDEPDVPRLVPVDESPSEGRDSDIMKVVESSIRGRLTKVGRIVGTPAYMAPEQYIPFGPHGISAQTDQFSFATSLYEALYGRLPFEGRDLYEICDEVRAGNVREPPRDSLVPGWVLRVLQRALRAEPDQRYDSMDALLTALAADPARRRRRVLGYATGAALIGLAAFGVVEAATEETVAPPVCQGAADRVAEVWNDQSKAAVEQGLMATERPFAADTTQRVLAGLNEYTDAWARQHTAVCEATQVHGEQSETLLDVRMNCLDRRRGELSALIGVLTTAEEDTVAAAITAVSSLRRPEPCTLAQPGVYGNVPTEPTRRAEFLALQARLDDANALLSAGRYAVARDRAAAARKSARSSGFDRILGEALLVEGTAHRQLREPEPARERLREAITIATESGDARTEFYGWVELLYIAGVMLHDTARAEDWQFAAEGALRRADSPRDLELTLALNLSAVMAGLGRLDDATVHGEQALRIATEMDDSLQRAQVLNNLGVIAAKQADWDLAERRLRQGHELKILALGSDHPDVLGSEGNLANVLVQYARKSGDPESARAAYDEAERLYSRVREFREQRDGPHSKSVARILSMHGLLLRRRGKADEARRTYERALEVLRVLPETLEEQVSVLINLARLERNEGRRDQARAHYEQALALQIERHGEDHVAVASTRVKLCQLLGETEHRSQAIDQCQLAIAILEPLPDARSKATLTEARGHLETAQRGLTGPQ